MLVLSRKCGERLYIGDDTIVTITKCTSGKVTLGIDAPKDVRIRRAELLKQAGAPADGCQAVDSCAAASS